MSEIADQAEIDRLREKVSDPGYLPRFEEVAKAFPSETRKLDDASEFNNFCLENDIYEYYNREFLDSLGSYLQKRCTDIRINGKPITILEVGAGKGQLTHWLIKTFIDNGVSDDSVQFIATDN